MANLSPSVFPSFPGRIGRRIGVSLALAFALVLLVGGISLQLARSIWLSTEEIKRQSRRMEVMNRLHASLHHWISVLQQGLVDGGGPSASSVRDIQTEVTRLLAEYQGELQEEAGDAGVEQEQEIFRAMRRTAEELFRLSTNQVGRPARTGGVDRRAAEALTRISRAISDEVHAMSGLYQATTRQLADANATSMRVILALYVAFLVLGSLLLAAASLLFSRTVVSPIQRLADATLAVADGDLDRRVSVASRDEIGQLSHTFNLMAARLGEQRAQLQHLASLEERHRIAMDLHDGVLQALYGIGLTLEACAEDFRQDPEQARQRLERARGDVDRVIRDIRKHFLDPGPAPPPQRATREILAEVVEAFRNGSGIPATLEVEGDRELPPMHAMHLAWIVQEALANVHRHAGAGAVAVRLAQAANGIRLSIRDDGAGFSVAEARRRAGNGLRNMAERARAMGGTVRVESAPGRGTEVVVQLLLHGEPAG